jgi:hypothetical protein
LPQTTVRMYSRKSDIIAPSFRESGRRIRHVGLATTTPFGRSGESCASLSRQRLLFWHVLQPMEDSQHQVALTFQVEENRFNFPFRFRVDGKICLGARFGMAAL